MEDHFLQAGGFLAINRWLSAATPPVTYIRTPVHPHDRIPKGCQQNQGIGMGSTYISLHYHIVFSTKHRQPLLDTAWRERMRKYLGGSVNGLQGVTQGVGGTVDHVHLLVGLKSTGWTQINALSC